MGLVAGGTTSERPHVAGGRHSLPGHPASSRTAPTPADRRKLAARLRHVPPPQSWRPICWVHVHPGSVGPKLGSRLLWIADYGGSIQSARRRLQEASASTGYSKALVKGLAIVDLLASHPRGLPFQELANQLELPKATAIRLLNALRRLAYIHDGQKLPLQGRATVGGVVRRLPRRSGPAHAG